MSRVRERAQISAHLTSRMTSDRQVRNWAKYVWWCEVNGRETLLDKRVDSEPQLLAFLHTSRSDRGWAPLTVREYMSAVRVAHVESGREDPKGPRLAAWLKAGLRENGGQPVLQKIDAITPEQLATAADNRPDRIDSDTVRRRGLLVVAFALRDFTAISSLRELRTTAFDVRNNSIIITSDNGVRGFMDAASQPILYAGLSAALVLAGQHPRPLFGAREQDRAAWVSAWRRAFADDLGPEEVWHKAAAANDDQVAWWMLNLDRGLQQRIQDRAYLLVGVLGGHRHATMARLTIGHFHKTSTGYSYEISPHEDKGGLLAARNGARLKVLYRNVDHLELDPAACPVWCPACALSDHLAMRAHHGARSESSLWVRVGTVRALLDGKPPGAARQTLRLRATLGEQVSENQWIATRSLRVTSATLAHTQGSSIAEVADHLGHYNAGSAEAYLRRTDPHGFNLVLSVASSRRTASKLSA